MAQHVKAEEILVVGARTGLGAEIYKQCQAESQLIVRGTTRESGYRDFFQLRYSNAHFESDLSVLHEKLLEHGSRFQKIFLCAAHNPDKNENHALISLEILKESYPSLDEYISVNAIYPVKLVMSLLENNFLNLGAKILFLSSRAGSSQLRGKLSHMRIGGPIFYRTSKACLNNLVVQMAFDLESTGLSITLVHPGFVDTKSQSARARAEVKATAAHLIRHSNISGSLLHGRFLDLEGKEIPF